MIVLQIFAFISLDLAEFSFCAEELKKLPAPEVAVKYYTEGDLYMFGKPFHFGDIKKY